MKTYACDKCGAEFYVDDDSYDDVCPECDSDRTTLLGDTDDGDCDDFDDDFDDEFGHRIII